MLTVTNLVGLGGSPTVATDPTFFQTTQLGGTSSINSRAGYTLVTKIPGINTTTSAVLVPSATHIRLTLQYLSGAADVLTNVAVGMRDTAVGADAFDAVSMTQITINAGNTWTFPGGIATFTSDIIAFNSTEANDLIFACEGLAQANTCGRRNNLNSAPFSLPGVVSYENNAATEAMTANKSTGQYGSGMANTAFFISKIEFGALT